MNEDTAICGYKKCRMPFKKTAHNQKYCTQDHCRLSTNERMAEKYYERKARRAGAVRVCQTKDCDTKLSRYNKDSICGKCEAQQRENSRKNLLDIFG